MKTALFAASGAVALCSTLIVLIETKQRAFDCQITVTEMHKTVPVPPVGKKREIPWPKNPWVISRGYSL